MGHITFELIRLEKTTHQHHLLVFVSFLSVKSISTYKAVVDR